MFDLHAHILPGVDDGSKNAEMSLAMVKIAHQTGTRQIVATPHVLSDVRLPSWEKVTAACDVLQKAALETDVNIAILPGAEVALYPDILELIAGPGPYCINGGRYMLVELPPSVIPVYIDDFFFKLQLRGITPILAHPERYPELRNDLAILERWISQGVLVQINGPSVTGLMGDKAKIAAEMMLKQDLVHCIGSDAHSHLYRSPSLAAERARIRELVGQERAEEMLSENPDCIINSRDVRKVNCGLGKRLAKRNVMHGLQWGWFSK